MSTEIIISIIGFITTTAGSTLSWFLARKKYNTEVDSSIINNMRESLEFYKSLSTDNKERLDEMLKRTDSLEEENNKLKNQMMGLLSSICIDLSCQLRKRDLTLLGGKQ